MKIITKKELIEKINERLIKKNVKSLKETFAYLLGLDKIGDNLYILYDSEMFYSNFDLFYLAKLNEEGFIEIISDKGYATKDILKKDMNIQ